MVLKMNVFVALLVAMVACAVLGLWLNVWRTKPLRNSTRVAALITAIKMSYLLENAMSYFFGAESRPFPSDFGTETITLFGDVSVNGKEILIFGVTVVSNGVITIYRSLYKNGESHAWLPLMSKQLNSYGDWRRRVISLHLRSVQRLPGFWCSWGCTTIRFQQQWELPSD